MSKPLIKSNLSLFHHNHNFYIILITNKTFLSTCNHDFAESSPRVNLLSHNVMAILCLDNKNGLDLYASDEYSTIDYETLVSQHKDPLYYSESQE